MSPSPRAPDAGPAHHPTPIALEQPTARRCSQADEGEEDYERRPRLERPSSRWGTSATSTTAVHSKRSRMELRPLSRGTVRDAKGIEAEGPDDGRCSDESELMFVDSERGAFVAVYQLDAWNTADDFFQAAVDRAGDLKGCCPFPASNLLGDGQRRRRRRRQHLDFPGRAAANGRHRPGQPGTPLAKRPRRAVGRAVGTRAWGRVGLVTACTSSAGPARCHQALFHIDTGSPYCEAFARVAPITRDGVQMLYDLEGMADGRLHRAAPPVTPASGWCRKATPARRGESSSSRSILRQGADASPTLPADVDVPGGLGDQQRLRRRGRVQQRALPAGGGAAAVLSAMPRP